MNVFVDIYRRDKMRLLLGAVIVAVLLAGNADAQVEMVVFRGEPKVRVMEAGLGRAEDPVGAPGVDRHDVVIVERDGNFFWASRSNIPMFKVPGETGAFETYIAINGAGYVRIVKPELKLTAGAVNRTSAVFDYVEHLTNMLGSATYWGIRLD